MQFANRLFRRAPHLRRVSTVIVEVGVTGAALAALHRLGLVGTLPIQTILALLFLGSVSSMLAERRWKVGCSLVQLHLRIAVSMATTTAVVYAIGWGPTLAVGYVVVATDQMREFGSSAWRPAAIWTVVGVVTGQITVALGLVPTYVRTPQVHGLAALATLALIFIIRALGLKTAALEAEADQRARAEETARRGEHRFRALVQNSSDVVTVVDATGKITYVSPSIERVLGYTPEDFMRSSGFAWIHPEDLAGAHEIFEAILANPGQEHSLEVRTLHANGTWPWHEVTVRNLLHDPAVAGIVANHRDITDRKAYQDRLAHEARHDPLTGLANRKSFLEHLDQALARCRRQHRGVAVLFVDLDRFKLVNDSLGHNLGDQLLTAVASRLEACLRPEDTVARLSGDEFTVLIEDVFDPATAIHTAERLAEELRLPLPLGDGQIVITASVGIAVSRRGAESSEELLCRADLAMYAAKEGGRARAAVFDEVATPQFVDRVELEAGLRSALERDELVLHYQPIVSLPKQDITGFEALVRWQHPARGLLAPAAFVTLAEETGLIIPIGQWVLEQACKTLAAWLACRPDRAGVTMHVNVSPVQLHQAGYASEVARALEMSGLRGGSLVLEITESVLVRADATADVLRDLHEVGVGVALDDFGTGYSSLAYLRRLPLEFVKIDRSFVNDLDDPDADTAIVRAIIDLAHTLGLGTVAEGVETYRQVDALVSLGCLRAQGYLFSVPVPAVAAEALLDRRPPLVTPPVPASFGSRPG